MSKSAEKNEFITGIRQILKDYRDVLSFQDRIILTRKFSKKGVVSAKSIDIVNELDCNWVDVGNAIQKLVHILRVKNKWLHEESTRLADASKTKNAAVISWLDKQRKSVGKIATQLCALRDEEKVSEEAAKKQWHAERAKALTTTKAGN